MAGIQPTTFGIHVRNDETPDVTLTPIRAEVFGVEQMEHHALVGRAGSYLAGGGRRGLRLFPELAEN